jgi:hypothetical protein
MVNHYKKNIFFNVNFFIFGCLETLPILNPSSGLGLDEMCGFCKKDFGADYVI